MKDEIVHQVRQARERQAAKFGFDLKAIIADARKRQKCVGRSVVSFVPKARKAL